MKKILTVLHGFALLALLAACAGLPAPGEVAPAGSGGQAALAQSSKPYDPNPKTSASELQQLAADNRVFAFNLYQQLRGQQGNLFFSPHSISVAVAMTYAGARGSTQQQIQQALSFRLPEASLHPAFNALQLDLAKREKDKSDDKKTNFKLSVVNALWGQNGYTFLPGYLDLLAQNYAAGMRLLDYQKDPEGARKTINDWVAQQTADKIKDLLPASAINPLTRLVLTNAIYFNAPWLTPFEAAQTTPGPFNLLNGSQVSAPTMQASQTYNYTHSAELSVVELPYAGGQVSMVLLVPDAGKFDQAEQSLSSQRWEALRKELKPVLVKLAMPKFSYSSEFTLNDALTRLGMSDAFDPSKADFSGMDGGRNLVLSSAIHKAFIKLDEQGTEAAAATAMTMQLLSMPREAVELKIDRPFFFLIQDKPTGEILFMGRVTNPLP